ncbi:MAG TPA: PP2C family protein-serine/threonine phosphatase [Bacteroidota bacterium]|nr:PP2C family protein-serine/threonine phosphatase [Bacteroidota bacterium]
MKTPAASPDTFVDRLSSRIESLQEGFRKLSRSAGLPDLAKRFAETVGETVPGAAVDIVHRSGDAGPWTPLVTSGSLSDGVLARTAGEKYTLPCTVRRENAYLIVVQKLADKSQLGIMMIPGDGGGEFSEADVVSLRLFVQYFDNAYQDLMFRRNEKGLVFSLNHRVLQLNSLIETGIEVAKLDHHDAPHHLAIVRAASLTNAARGVVTVSSGKEVREEYTFPVGTVVNRSSRDMNSIVARFSFLENTYRFELFDKESRSGATPFEETDHLLLDALARQVHASLENRYLHEQALEKQRIEQEMSVAASIQQKILPVGLPDIAGYDLWGTNIPSKSVGGDYYNCIPLYDGRFALIIADVAGKGVPAALLVSSLHAYLSAYLEGSFALTRLAARLNKVLYNDSTADKFITAFFALLTPENGDLECLSAGHNPAYILRNDRSLVELHAGGLPLGTIDMDLPYKSERATLQKGERLFLYTDGVTEAENESHVLYENEFPVTDFLARHVPDSSETFIDELLVDIRKFTRSAPQNDDITAMYLRRLAGPSQ